MSAFLGKIHYWLYDKIKLHEKLIEAVMDLAEKKGYSSDTLLNDSYSKFGLPVTGPLEDEIEHSNIHGWLQMRITSVESRLAYVTTELLKNKILTKEEIADAFYKSGANIMKELGSEERSPEDVFTLIFDYMLEGMPCDRVNEVTESSETMITWKTTIDIHKDYWNEANGDVKDYSYFRDAFINGFLSNTAYKYTRTENGINTIQKSDFMDGISLMIDEHKNIKRMLVVIRKASLGIMNGKEIDYSDFEAMVDFVRNYADKHHHGKEEKFLFNKMIDEIGGPAEKLVKFGMLVEHDLGRLYMTELQEALAKVKAGDAEAKLDVIANAVSYTHLLTRHIDKEDKVVYTFAKRELSEETLNTINKECQAFEEEMNKDGLQSKYIEILNGLEKKYM